MDFKDIVQRSNVRSGRLPHSNTFFLALPKRFILIKCKNICSLVLIPFTTNKMDILILGLIRVNQKVYYTESGH